MFPFETKNSGIVEIFKTKLRSWESKYKLLYIYIYIYKYITIIYTYISI